MDIIGPALENAGASLKGARRFRVNPWVSLAFWVPFGGPLSAKVFEIKAMGFEGISSANASLPSKLQGRYIGQEFHPSLGQEVINWIYGTGEVQSVSLVERDGTLVIQCEARPRIAAIDVCVQDANLSRSSNEEDVITEGFARNGVVVGGKFDPTQLDQLLTGLRAEQEQRGVHDFVGSYQALPVLAGGGAVRLRIHCLMGRAAVLKDVSILGASGKVRPELYEQLTHCPTWYRRHPLASGISSMWLEPFKARDSLNEQQAIERHYHTEGYLAAKLAPPQVTLAPSKDGLYVTYVVLDEGEEYRWGELSVSGDAAAMEALEGFELSDQEGKPFKRSDLEVLRDRLKYRLKECGYQTASVEYAESEHPEDPTVENVKFYCTAGPRTYVRRVELESEVPLSAKTYLNYLQLKNGSVAYSAAIESDINRLYLLGCFGDVNCSLVPVPDRPNLVDVIYKGTPSQSAGGLSVSFNGSFNSRAGAQFTYGTQNLLCRGRGLSLTAEAQAPEKMDWSLDLKALRSNLGGIRGKFKVEFQDEITFNPNLGYQIGFETGGGLGDLSHLRWGTCVPRTQSYLRKSGGLDAGLKFKLPWKGVQLFFDIEGSKSHLRYHHRTLNYQMAREPEWRELASDLWNGVKRLSSDIVWHRAATAVRAAADRAADLGGPRPSDSGLLEGRYTHYPGHTLRFKAELGWNGLRQGSFSSSGSSAAVRAIGWRFVDQDWGGPFDFLKIGKGSVTEYWSLRKLINRLALTGGCSTYFSSLPFTGGGLSRIKIPGLVRFDCLTAFPIRFGDKVAPFAYGADWCSPSLDLSTKPLGGEFVLSAFPAGSLSTPAVYISPVKSLEDGPHKLSFLPPVGQAQPLAEGAFRPAGGGGFIGGSLAWKPSIDGFLPPGARGFVQLWLMINSLMQFRDGLGRALERLQVRSGNRFAEENEEFRNVLRECRKNLVGVGVAFNLTFKVPILSSMINIQKVFAQFNFNLSGLLASYLKEDCWENLGWGRPDRFRSDASNSLFKIDFGLGSL